ncbi:hypothetical protein CRW13_19755 [Salmonella enterica subsp. enterica serovar Senftenberg]|nr:hypothetical protein [Salmonella enterica]EDO3009307.1 hypothetical protein [Salmonella enterica subsp. enterica serovar Senftenberg]
MYAILYRISGVACARKVSHILLYAPSFPSFAALPQRKIFRSRKSGISAENRLSSAKTSSAL